MKTEKYFRTLREIVTDKYTNHFNAYDGDRNYLVTALVAQNVVATASGAVATTTTTGVFPATAENTFLCSLAAVPSGAASSNLVANASIKALVYTVSGTTTSTTTSSALTLSAAQLAVAPAPGNSIVFSSAIPVQAAYPILLITSGTGTASATETISALNVTAGCGPQFT
jgi:hypothetical protein